MSYTFSEAGSRCSRSLLMVSMFLSVATLANAQETFWKDSEGRAVPETESLKSKDNFGGMLIITPDADWKQKWETSPETIPRYTTADTVERGNKLTILIFFVNPAVDEAGEADVTCDIQSVRPDGTFSVDVKDVGCFRGKLIGGPHYVRLAAPVLAYTAEPKDLAGEWTFHVTLKDNRRGVVLPLKTSFTLK